MLWHLTSYRFPADRGSRPLSISTLVGPTAKDNKGELGIVVLKYYTENLMIKAITKAYCQIAAAQKPAACFLLLRYCTGPQEGLKTQRGEGTNSISRPFKEEVFAQIPARIWWSDCPPDPGFDGPAVLDLTQRCPRFGRYTLCTIGNMNININSPHFTVGNL